MQSCSDKQLINHYLQGDEKSLEFLVKRYLKPIYGFVFRQVRDKEIAEDITQETFLKVWRNIKKINKNKNVKSWIFTIAKNTTLDFFKKKKSIPFSSFETKAGKNYVLETLADNLLLPDKVSESLEAKQAFMEAVEKLSSKYRAIFSLYYYQYFNFREIAEILKEPINTIKSRHRRGILLLKEILNGTL